jgi:hypothetical protein
MFLLTTSSLYVTHNMPMTLGYYRSSPYTNHILISHWKWVSTDQTSEKPEEQVETNRDSRRYLHPDPMHHKLSHMNEEENQIHLIYSIFGCTLY